MDLKANLATFNNVLTSNSLSYNNLLMLLKFVWFLQLYHIVTNNAIDPLLFKNCWLKTKLLLLLSCLSLG